MTKPRITHIPLPDGDWLKWRVTWPHHSTGQIQTADLTTWNGAVKFALHRWLAAREWAELQIEIRSKLGRSRPMGNA